MADGLCCCDHRGEDYTPVLQIDADDLDEDQSKSSHHDVLIARANSPEDRVQRAWDIASKASNKIQQLLQKEEKTDAKNKHNITTVGQMLQSRDLTPGEKASYQQLEAHALEFGPQFGKAYKTCNKLNTAGKMLLDRIKVSKDRWFRNQPSEEIKRQEVDAVRFSHEVGVHELDFLHIREAAQKARIQILREAQGKQQQNENDKGAKATAMHQMTESVTLCLDVARSQYTLKQDLQQLEDQTKQLSSQVNQALLAEDSAHRAAVVNRELHQVLTKVTGMLQTLEHQDVAVPTDMLPINNEAVLNFSQKSQQLADKIAPIKQAVSDLTAEFDELEARFDQARAVWQDLLKDHANVIQANVKQLQLDAQLQRQLLQTEAHPSFQDKSGEEALQTLQDQLEQAQQDSQRRVAQGHVHELVKRVKLLRSQADSHGELGEWPELSEIGLGLASSESELAALDEALAQSGQLDPEHVKRIAAEEQRLHETDQQLHEFGLKRKEALEWSIATKNKQIEEANVKSKEEEAEKEAEHRLLQEKHALAVSELHLHQEEAAAIDLELKHIQAKLQAMEPELKEESAASSALFNDARLSKTDAELSSQLSQVKQDIMALKQMTLSLELSNKHSDVDLLSGESKKELSSEHIGLKQVADELDSRAKTLKLNLEGQLAAHPDVGEGIMKLSNDLKKAQVCLFRAKASALQEAADKAHQTLQATNADVHHHQGLTDQLRKDLENHKAQSEDKLSMYAQQIEKLEQELKEKTQMMLKEREATAASGSRLAEALIQGIAPQLSSFADQLVSRSSRLGHYLASAKLHPKWSTSTNGLDQTVESLGQSTARFKATLERAHSSYSHSGAPGNIEFVEKLVSLQKESWDLEAALEQAHEQVYLAKELALQTSIKAYQEEIKLATSTRSSVADLVGELREQLATARSRLTEEQQKAHLVQKADIDNLNVAEQRLKAVDERRDVLDLDQPEFQGESSAKLQALIAEADNCIRLANQSFKDSDDPGSKAQLSVMVLRAEHAMGKVEEAAHRVREATLVQQVADVEKEYIQAMVELNAARDRTHEEQEAASKMSRSSVSQDQFDEALRKNKELTVKQNLFEQHAECQRLILTSLLGTLGVGPTHDVSYHELFCLGHVVFGGDGSFTTQNNDDLFGYLLLCMGNPIDEQVSHQQISLDPFLSSAVATLVYDRFLLEVGEGRTMHDRRQAMSEAYKKDKEVVQTSATKLQFSQVFFTSRIEQLKDVFDLIDYDNSKTIEWEEMGRLWYAMHEGLDEYSYEQGVNRFDLLDDDGDRKIDFAEFIYHFRVVLYDTPPEQFSRGVSTYTAAARMMYDDDVPEPPPLEQI